MERPEQAREEGERDEPMHSQLLSSLPNKCMVELQGDEASPLHRSCSLVSQMTPWSVGQLLSLNPLSIQRTGFGLLTFHIAVTSRRAVPLLGVCPMKKCKEYFRNKGAEAAEL